MKAAMLLVSLLATASAIRLQSSDSPTEQALDSEYRAKDSFGNTALTPACAKIECGEYSCPTPFELKVDATCCGYCWAKDDEIAIDRHVAVPYNSSGMVVQQCDSAPSTCKGPGIHPVRCFKPVCRAGDVPHCGPGACCAMCKGRFGGLGPEPETTTPAPGPVEPVPADDGPEPGPAPPGPTPPAPKQPEPEPEEPEIEIQGSTTPRPFCVDGKTASGKDCGGSIRTRKVTRNGVTRKFYSKDGGKTWVPMTLLELSKLTPEEREQLSQAVALMDMQES